MMFEMTAFVSSAPLRTRPISHARHRNRQTAQCTITPNRPDLRNNRVKKPKTYQALPAGLRATERPPPPPHHRSVPIVGYFIEKALGLHKSNVEKRDLYGPIHSTDYFIEPQTIISDYDTICEVMRDWDLFQSFDAQTAVQAVFGDKVLLVLDGADHAKCRKPFNLAYSPLLFPYYLDGVQKRVRSTFEHIRAAVAKDGTVQLEPLIRKLFLAITIEMTTGVDMDGKYSEKMPQLYRDTLSVFFTPRILPQWKKGMHAREELMDILRDILREKIVERREIIEKFRKFGDDIAKIGLQNGEADVLLVLISSSNLSTMPGAELDEQVVTDICGQMVGLWLAGATTTSVSCLSSWFELGFNEKLRMRLIAEQESIVAAHGGDNTVTYKQMGSEMPLLDSFLTETSRMYPGIEGMNRKTSKDTQILGRFVPKGTVLRLDFATAHRDPNIYPNPNHFDEERFLKKMGVEKPPSVLSFGAPGSPHYCVGAAFAKSLLKTTMSTLLREYVFEMDPKQSRTFSVIPEIMPESGVVVNKFEKRNVA